MRVSVAAAFTLPRKIPPVSIDNESPPKVKLAFTLVAGLRSRKVLVKYWFPALGVPVTPVQPPAELKLLLPDPSPGGLPPPLNVAVPSANAAGAASRVRMAATTK